MVFQRRHAIFLHLVLDWRCKSGQQVSVSMILVTLSVMAVPDTTCPLFAYTLKASIDFRGKERNPLMMGWHAFLDTFDSKYARDVREEILWAAYSSNDPRTTKGLGPSPIKAPG